MAPLMGIVEMTVGGVTTAAARGGEGPDIVLGQRGSRQIHCSGGNGRRVDRARQQVGDRLEYRDRTSRDIGDYSRYARRCPRWSA